MTEAPTFSPSLRPYDHDYGQAGLLVPQRVGLGTFTGSPGAELVANRKYGVRMVPSRDMLIETIGFDVTAVEGSGGNSAMDVGVFDATGQTLLDSSGPTTGIVNSIGWKHIDLGDPLPLSAGVTYYVALATAATFTGTGARVWACFPGTSSGEPFGAAVGKIEIGVQLTAGGTLAAPYAPTSSSGLVPVFAVREA